VQQGVDVVEHPNGVHEDEGAARVLQRLAIAPWRLPLPDGEIQHSAFHHVLELVAERRWAAGEISGYSPFLMDRPGWRLTCTGSLRPKPGLTGSLWIRIDREDDRDTVVSGRMDARAYF